MEYEKSLRLVETGIEGLKIVELAVHGDNRGWFKENWQRQKMVELGVPDRRWVQNNVSYNERRGATRGIHGEPWDKFVSVATGSIFGAWVDLREGSRTYGTVFTTTIDASRAVYVPRGVINSYQALEDGTTYVYLVDAHWSAALKASYTFVNLADPDLAIAWPIPLDECELSEADRHHPLLRDVRPMAPKRTLVVGADGQLGRALRTLVEERGRAGDFEFWGRDEFDLTDPHAPDALDGSRYGALVNCAAYTNVDGAETAEGRRACWAANAVGPARLARACADAGITLVHVSSDYVFDGTVAEHDEDETPTPLSVYGQAKAAGDLAVRVCPSHYLLRTSWVVGQGRNFVRTMARLSDRVADPHDDLTQVRVVNDQLGRPTFARQLARGILHLLETSAPFGCYDLTGSGEPTSWHELARRVFDLRNGNGSPEVVVGVSTDEYSRGSKGPVAPRPRSSVLSLCKLASAGFVPDAWEDELERYVKALPRPLAG
ncbi:bifunctional dTDP-4-dehydrorhamnose 3,5-epimerase family protein/NAD(P)-dependent oxidoreductase [Olsenella sp. HMSC062G07]|uniref:sugar nucleotide-binding protein n=1 Tax=Olsenella sp. HMSC062G07 TaxID=1739330 RepID=UPI0008A36D42|nr:bifunctional dTDP-4-dehydrorhamnose 3,5-epimerase family protein/NAD(P)-dependent oxidoreductase [Olsenella sp. HMSC062G07]OFK23365.1 dTDP-4-dehydrorhamnose reductase [Olsenella sp. HMSC062G07]